MATLGSTVRTLVDRKKMMDKMLDDVGKQMPSQPSKVQPATPKQPVKKVK